jgi:hypothetical protein
MRFAVLTFACALAALATPAAAQQGPCFYVQPNYQGSPICIGPNERVPSLPTTVNDRFMSVQIPRGVRVTMCADANFQGGCLNLDQSVPNFAAIGAAGKVSSVASEAAGAAPPGRPGGQASAPPPPPAAAPPPRQYSAPQPPPPPAQAGGPQYGAPPAPPAYGPPAGLRNYNDWRETRRVMGMLRRQCEDGDTRACVQFGIIIGENRERRAQWRRDAPDLFWWEQ